MNNKSGFTLIEVLMATTLFAVLATSVYVSNRVALVNLERSEQVFIATQLAQDLILDYEKKLQKDINEFGVEGTVFEEEGNFDAPYEHIRYKMLFKKTGVQISNDQLLAMFKEFGFEEDDANAQLEANSLMLTNLNKTLETHFGALHISVEWDHFKRTISFDLVTHLIPDIPKVEITTVKEEASN